MQAEQAMQTELARYRHAERLGRSGCWEQKTGDGTVTLSEGAKALFGLPSCECPLPDFEDLTLPEYRERLERAKQALISEGLPFILDYKIRRKDDGAVILIRSVAEYDPEAGNILCGPRSCRCFVIPGLH